MWKRFWWLWVILAIVLIAFGLAAYNGIMHNKQLAGGTSKSSKDTKGLDGLKKAVMDSDIPLCPSDTSTIFTKAFMDGDKPDFITPLGNSYAESHVVPTDHVYPTDKIKGEVGAVYAPGNMTLVWVENKQMYNKATNEKIAPDYQLNFAPCRGINLAFIHFSQISDKLTAALSEPIDSNCDMSQKIDYGTRNGVETYYVTCHPSFKKVTVEAGELIGHFGYKESEKDFSGYDIGLYDYNKPALAFISPERYYDDTVHTACFADYYIPQLKAKYEAKFGSYSEDSGVFEPRTTAPVCGKVMYDVAGTASGDWFKNPIQKDNMTDQDALVLIHDNIKPDMARMSMAGVISFTFTPKHEGTINREFSEVKVDGKIYCYQSDDNNSGSYVDKGGKTVTQQGAKYLLQLVDDTHIQAESQSGVCGGSETFKSPVEYGR